MPIFRVKSVKIYTGQKNLHWRRQPCQRQLSGMPPHPPELKINHGCAKTTWNNSCYLKWIQQKSKYKFNFIFFFQIHLILPTGPRQISHLNSRPIVLPSKWKSWCVLLKQVIPNDINATEITDYPGPCDVLMGMILPRLLTCSLYVFLIASENNEMSSL